MAARLGILGGTFDPPHIGHLLAAYAARELLGLDQVVFIPAWRQPLKRGVEMAAGHHRLAMTRLLLGADAGLAVDPLELEREGLSFTVDTMRSYRAARPDAELYLLMGADTAATLPQWKEPEVLATLVRVVVMTRGRADQADEEPAGLRVASRFASQQLASRRVDVSATEVRARVRAGLPIRGFVPDGVAAYISAHQLYRSTRETE